MINWKIDGFETLDSTQNQLKELVDKNLNLPEGYVISADIQSNGYGRYGRKWEGSSGNIFISFIIRPECNIGEIGQISLFTALALSNVIESIISSEPILKWPNDVLINGKKCCGILIEASPIKDGKIDYLIIGIGINIKSAPIDTACFIQQYCNSSIDNNKFLERFLKVFADYYEEWSNNGFTNLRGNWLSKTYEVGKKITVKIGDDHISGSFEDIDMLGNLILICNKSGERKIITSGEVFLL